MTLAMARFSLWIVLLFIVAYSSAMPTEELEKHESNIDKPKIEDCPPACKCVWINRIVQEKKTFDVKVKCSKKEMKFLPSVFPADTVEIRVKYSQIESIDAKAFISCKNVERIHFSVNKKLQKINKMAFWGLDKLQEINLSNNKLSYNRNSLPDTVFSNLSSLASLNISVNLPFNDSGYLSNDLMKTLAKIKRLIIDWKKDLTLPPGFKYLNKLETFEVFSPELFTINKDMLENVNNLPIKKLTVFGGKLIYLDNEAFECLPHLETLDLGGNKKLGLSNLTTALSGLQHTKIKYLFLDETDSYYSSHKLRLEFLQNLKNVEIKTLSMDSCGITDIERIEQIADYLPHIEELILASNHIQNWNSDATPTLFQGLSNMTNLHTFDFKFQYHANPVFENEKNWTMHFPPKMQDLIFSGYFTSSVYLRDFQITLPSSENHNSSTVNLDISYNKLQRWNGRITVYSKDDLNPINMILNLSNNQCSHVGKNFFDGAANVLHTLDLRGNWLHGTLDHDYKGNVFARLNKLQMLDISRNEFRYFLPNVFIGLFGLRHLRISSNTITFLDFNLDHMVHLEKFDLSFNLITHLDINITRQIDKIILNRNSSEKLFELDVYGNALQCECATLGFIEWVITKNSQKKIKFTNFEQLKCEYSLPNQQGVKRLPINEETLRMLKIQCSSLTWLKITGGVFCFFLAMLVLSFFVYRHKWDIRYMMLRLTTARKKFDEINRRQDFDYDAFVAFHETNVTWVEKTLRTTLESTPYRFRMCVHYRDFTAGYPITENIIESVTNSRKTILVLSKDFIESEWCQYETQMAKLHCLDEGVNNLIVIRLEPITDNMLRKMSGTLRQLLRTTTYIEWPRASGTAGSGDFQENVDHFWEKLTEAIRVNDIPQTTRCTCGKTMHANP